MGCVELPPHPDRATARRTTDPESNETNAERFTGTSQAGVQGSPSGHHAAAMRLPQVTEVLYFRTMSTRTSPKFAGPRTLPIPTSFYHLSRKRRHAGATAGWWTKFKVARYRKLGYPRITKVTTSGKTALAAMHLIRRYLGTPYPGRKRPSRHRLFRLVWCDRIRPVTITRPCRPGGNCDRFP